jgi:hypothetical protein
MELLSVEDLKLSLVSGDGIFRHELSVAEVRGEGLDVTGH